MADTKQQALSLIDELEVEESVKQKLRSMLDKDGVTPDLIVELKIAAIDAQRKLNKENKPMLDELKKLEADEQAELAKAYQEYEMEMDELDKDAESLVDAASKAMEDQKMEEARSKIANQ